MANTASASATVIRLQSGGLALRTDPSQMSFLVAERGADGKVTLSHAPAKADATKSKGAGHVH